MSVSGIIDPSTKKIFPALLNGQGGSVDSVGVKDGLVNVGTAIDPIIGFNTDVVKGKLLVGNGTANEMEPLAVGANNTVLIADSAEALGMKWANATTGTLAQTLANGADANNVAITGLGDLTFGTGNAITGPAGAQFNIVAGAGQNIDIGGTAITLTSSNEIELNSGADITLKADAVGALIRLQVAPLAFPAITPQAGALPASCTQQLIININGTDYHIPCSASAFP